MATIPEYQIETKDIDTFQTRNTGGQAQASDFNPFDGNAASKLENGLDALQNSEEKVQTKEDLAWAQQQFTGAQVRWLEKSKGYTDPDKMTQDLQADTQDMMKQAPNGQASDFLVQHMNSFAPRMVRRVLVNQAKSQVDATSDATLQSYSNLAAAANPDAVGPTGGAAFKMGSTDIRQLDDQVQQVHAASTGIVPTKVNDQAAATARLSIGNATIDASKTEIGPMKTAVDLATGGVVAPGSMPANALKLRIEQLRSEGFNNHGVAELNAKTVRDMDMTDAGNGHVAPMEVLESHADDFANVYAGKKGLMHDAAKIDYLQAVQHAGEVSQGDANKFEAKKMLNADQIAVAHGTLGDDEALVHRQQYMDAMGGKDALGAKAAGMEYDAALQQIRDAGAAGEGQAKAKAMTLQDINDVHNGKLNMDSTALNTRANEIADLVVPGKNAAELAQVKAHYIAEVQGAQDAAALNASIIGSTPNEVQQKLLAFQANHDETTTAFNRAKTFSDKLLTDLQKSPGDYAINDPTYQKNYAAAKDQLIKSGDDPKLQQAAIGNFQSVLQTGITKQMQAQGVDTNPNNPDGTLNLQKAMAISRATESAGVIPTPEAKAYVQQIQSGNTTQAVATLHQMQDHYGQYWPNALKDMSRVGLPQSFALIAAYRDQPIESEMVNALNGESPPKGTDSWNKLLNAEDPSTGVLNKVKVAVANSTMSYQNAFGWNKKGADGVQDMRSVVEAMTKQNMVEHGMDVVSAAKKAANDSLNSQFDFGVVNGRSFAITKSNVPNDNTSDVIAGAKRVLPFVASQQTGNPDVGAVFGKKDELVTQNDKDEYQQALNKYGFWISSPDGKGLRLAIDANKATMDNPRIHNFDNMSGTGISYPLAKNGKPLDYPFAMIQTWARGTPANVKPLYIDNTGNADFTGHL